jgi:hypothetical protein
VASQARSSSGRSTPAKSRGAGAGKSAGTAKRSSSSGSGSTKRSSPAAKSRQRSRTAASSNRSSASRSTRSTSSNGSGPNGAVSAVTDTIGSAARKASTPILAGGAAAAGLVGGMVIGKRVLGPRRTVLGIPVRKGLGLEPMAKEVGKAGRQIARLTEELAQARKQAKKVGDALS